MEKKALILKKESLMLNKIAKQLKAMDISETQEILSMLDRLSSKKLTLAQELDAKARLMNLKIYVVRVKRPVRKQKIKIYSYWYASYRVNSKVKNICLGNIDKMTHDEALAKARKLKADCLCISLW